jgi:hypothetical protein
MLLKQGKKITRDTESCVYYNVYIFYSQEENEIKSIFYGNIEASAELTNKDILAEDWKIYSE